ncbi:MAG TPA: hypothetical protein VKP12_05925, partial [Kiloniellaceae bacterium]|nr:hypothetical protein [Kiloniellaceae bacterium]
TLAGGGSAKGLARGLGWLSLGLGMAELIAPRSLGRTIGADVSPTLVRACGLRELVSGIGILTSSDPRPWVWSRIAGDALDLAALAPALGQDSRRRGAAGIAFGTVAAVTALDIACAARLERERARVPPEWRRPARRDYSDRSGFPRSPAAMRGRGRARPGAEDASGLGTVRTGRF